MRSIEKPRAGAGEFPGPGDQIENSRDWSARRKSSADDRAVYVRGLFSKIAPRYDFMNAVISLGSDVRLRRRAVTGARFTPGSRILDVGTGTGEMARAVLSLVPESLVVGVDNCAELMERGRRKPFAGRMEWVVSDARVLPFPDGSFDGVTAAFSIRNMPDIPRVLLEVRRVLKSGGKFVIVDMVYPDRRLAKAVFRLHFGFVIPLLGRLIGSDPEAYAYLGPSIERFYTFEALRNVLSGLGLKETFARSAMAKSLALWVGVK